MPRTSIRATAAVSLFFTAACTQNPAVVDLKGQDYYGRSGARYASRQVESNEYGAVLPSFFGKASPAAGKALPVDQYASVQSVGVSDLSPPAPKAPAKTAASAKPQPVILSSDAGQRINPWTGKPRAGLENTRDVKPVVGKQASSGDFIWPVNGNKIISGFGPKGGGKVNDGINIAAPQGEPVWAAADGEVIYSGNELAGYGNMIIVKHADGKTTTYAHLSSLTVDKYERVAQGDIIGYVGSSGNVKDSQLHFAIRDGKEFIDPTKYISRSVAGL